MVPGFKELIRAEVGGSQKFKVDNNGATMVGKYTTGTRPSASASGEGAQIYDITIDKPIWSDGTNWKDAMGNAA